MLEDQNTKSIKPKEDPLVAVLHKIIHYTIKALAVLMIVVIFATMIDVIYILYDKIFVSRPIGFFHIEDILGILGAFIAVLIAIEVFNNIIVYLHENTLHVRLVLSTALIAISRKVIILDYNNTSAPHLYAIAAVIFATAISYWVVCYKDSSAKTSSTES